MSTCDVNILVLFNWGITKSGEPNSDFFSLEIRERRLVPDTPAPAPRFLIQVTSAPVPVPRFTVQAPPALLEIPQRTVGWGNFWAK